MVSFVVVTKIDYFLRDVFSIEHMHKGMAGGFVVWRLLEGLSFAYAVPAKIDFAGKIN